MGSAYGSVCFADDASAASAACASVGGSSAAGAISCTGVASVSGGSGLLNLSFVAPGATSTAQQAVTFPACDPLTVGDGIQLGWLVGAVFLGVAGLRFIARGRHGR